MSGLFGRVFQYLVNEVAVKSLAESRAFQRFALRSHQQVEQTKTAITKGADSLHGNLKHVQSGFSEFKTALGEEIKKDINRLNKK